MSDIFEGIYLFSDIDGTLGRTEIGIPKRNIEAIKRFTDKGGTFGVATGRYLSDLTDFIKEVPINGYSLINNGASIYSFYENKFLYNKMLPEKSFEYFEKLANENLDWGLVAVNKEGYLNVNHITDRIKFDVKFSTVNLEDLEGPFYKFLFLVDKNKIKSIIKSLNEDKYFEGVYFVQSGDNLFEMVLKGVSKGDALKLFCSEKNIDIKNTFFIGDSFNDEQIMSTAGISACTDITDDYLKSKCNFIAGSCENGAVADFIEYIEHLIINKL
ncbi:Cof-type HAD-IIB family hydrolase [uncultured Tyzzerella sp.]|uniref:Cof-type HAD-IIB family hydrolase n=1 Tax=uncultured Tyzzerella sp. TaxID=2321398 RepID=UPI00294213DD|nr:Cof-type HAD-IIB family hydrolase [uncultured Tyzzerella sp.]